MTYAWNEGGASKYIKLKVGEDITVTINAIENKEGKYNLGNNDWHPQLDTDKGLWSVTNWGLYFALKGAGVEQGGTYNIKYVKQGGLGKPSVFEIKEATPTEDEGIRFP